MIKSLPPPVSKKLIDFYLGLNYNRPMAGDTLETRLPYAHRLKDLVRRNTEGKQSRVLESYIKTGLVKTREVFPLFTTFRTLGFDFQNGGAVYHFFEQIEEGNTRAVKDVSIRTASYMVDHGDGALSGLDGDELRSFLDLAADFSIVRITRLLGDTRRSGSYDRISDKSGIETFYRKRLQELQQLQRDLGERAAPTPPAQRR